MKGLIQAACQRLVARLESPSTQGHDAVASAFWYLIKLQAEPAQSIGGGLAAGYCFDKQFFWPIVEVEGQRFYRGIPVNEEDLPPGPQKIGIFRPVIDTEAARQLDLLVAEEQSRSYDQSRASPDFTRTIDELGSPFVEEPEPGEVSFMWL